MKGGPIINDATIQDAFYVGMDKLPNVEFLTLSNGDPGTGPTRNSQIVKKWIEEHQALLQVIVVRDGLRGLDPSRPDTRRIQPGKGQQPTLDWDASDESVTSFLERI